MKNIIKLLVVIIAILSFSCDDVFLEQNSPDLLSSANFWRNTNDAEAGLATVYAQLAWGMCATAENLMVIENFRSDVTEPGPDASNYPDWVTLSTFTNTNGNGKASLIWKKYYKGIFNANQVVAKVGEMTADKISDANKKTIIAEATFLRAYFHFHLLLNWEKIIIQKAAPEGEDDIEKPLSTREEAWAFIEEDLIKAANDLPASQGNGKLGRATKGAALGYLGKVYLYQKKWSEAAATLKQVIDLGKYSLVPDFPDNFIGGGANENNAESVFEIQIALIHSNGEYEGNSLKGFTTPGPIGGWGCMEFNEVLFADIISEGKIASTGSYDTRILKTIAFNDPDVSLNGSTYADVFGASSTDVEFVKYWDLDETYWTGENNIRRLRYADILLMFAEALNEQGQISEAYTYLSQVRARADMPAKSGSDQAQFRTDLEHERMVEFAIEGQRFYDLYRWGKLENAMRSSGKNGADNFDVSIHAFLPIPEGEIQTNSNIN
jgi:tetratricopeptide (TPR) repeat protein